MKNSASQPIKWEEGKMYLEPGKTYLMTGRELVEFGYYIDADRYLIATTIEYIVRIGLKWEIHQKAP